MKVGRREEKRRCIHTRDVDFTLGDSDLSRLESPFDDLRLDKK